MKFRTTMLLAALLATAGCGGDDDDSSGLLSPTSLVPDTPITVWAELDGRQSNDVTITVGPGMVLPDVALQLP